MKSFPPVDTVARIALEVILVSVYLNKSFLKTDWNALVRTRTTVSLRLLKRFYPIGDAY